MGAACEYGDSKAVYLKRRDLRARDETVKTWRQKAVTRNAKRKRTKM